MTNEVEQTQVMTVTAAPPIPVALPRVNLLPPEIHAGRTLRRVQMGFGAAALASLLAVGGLWYNANLSVQSEQSRLDAATVAQAKATADVQKLSWVTATLNAIDTRKAMVGGALQNEVQWSRYFNDLSITVPPSVWVQNMTVTPATAAPPAASGSAATQSPAVATISFSGYALSHDDVALWLESFAKQKAYVNVYFSDSTLDASSFSQPTYKFTSTLTVTSAALKSHAAGSSGS
jgi:Tfp pilus assembly protein PilN